MTGFFEPSGASRARGLPACDDLQLPSIKEAPLSFAKEFSRSVRGIEEEIAYYRTFASLDGMTEPIAVLEEMRDKWQQRNLRYEGRGRAITEPFDWQKDRQLRNASKESMNKIIKVAKAAEAAACAPLREAGPEVRDVGGTSPISSAGEPGSQP